MKKIKKIILIGLFGLLLFVSANLFFTHADVCGCASTYQKASFVESYCVFVDGKMIFRRCVYAY